MGAVASIVKGGRTYFGVDSPSGISIDFDETDHSIASVSTHPGNWSVEEFSDDDR